MRLSFFIFLFFSLLGSIPAYGDFIWPLNGKVIRDYVKGVTDGIDISAAAGTNVVAVESGTVAAITNDAKLIPIVVIKHSNGLLSVYANIENISVSKGMSVSRGQRLGSVRNGNPSYIHFEMRKGFESLNPRNYLSGNPKQRNRYLANCSMNKSQIVEVQTYLKELDLYPFEIDGVMGKGTASAIRKVKERLGDSASKGECLSKSDISSINKLAAMEKCGANSMDACNNVKSGENSGESCGTDPKKCSAVELCSYGTETISGKRLWKTDEHGIKYANAAKSVGLTCNIQAVDASKTFKVANGTGFYVSRDGFIVTNQHVISGCNDVQVHLDGYIAETKVIREDTINDLAVLKTDLKPKSVFKLASKNPYLLQEIVAAGFPFGDRISSSIKVTTGVVSSLSGIGNNSGQIQIDAALQPGNSGGPIINRNGNVVGVAVAKLDYKHAMKEFGTIPENVNFGIKLANLKTLLDDTEVGYSIGEETEINNSSLGKLASQATVLLSCWMTEARYQEMQSQKAMFNEVN